MNLIDSRGRLFDRWNIVDVAMVGACLILAAVGIGAFVLFRTPIPTIASVSPGEIPHQQPSTLSVSGEDFRSFLSVRIGSITAPLFVSTPSAAEVRLEGLPAGTYDFTLFDNARELVHIPDALTVLPPPAYIEIQALGTFMSPSEQDAQEIRQGTEIQEAFDAGNSPVASRNELAVSPIGEVLAVGPSEISTWTFRVSPHDASVVSTPAPGRRQLPAIVRLRCQIVGDYCNIGQTQLVTDASLVFSIPSVDSESSRNPILVTFRIDEIRQIETPVAFPAEPRMADAVVRAKFIATPEAALLVRAGDMELSVPTLDRPGGGNKDNKPVGAVILSIDTEMETVTAITKMTSSMPELEESMVTFDATLRVPVVLKSTGWRYAGQQPIKVGSLLHFEGAEYAMDGWIRTVHVDSDG